MAIDYEIYLGNQDAIDGMSSVIVNLNATGSPAYQWVTNELIKMYGAPDAPMGAIIPHGDTVSYKVKNMSEMQEHDATGTTPTWGDDACIASPASCNGRGPFNVLGRRYFVDYLYLYFYNTGDTTIYSPVFSLDDSKCDENYGYFIGTPRVNTNTNASPGSLITAAPTYTNDLSAIDTSVLYEFTTLNGASENIETTLTIPNILTLVDSTIANGQNPTVAEDSAGNAITIQPNEYHPFVLFRYISENAPTRPINISFRFGPYIG